MNDHETLELSRIVGSDPAHAGTPDVTALRAAGQRQLRRRRLALGAASVAAATTIAVPTYVVANGLSNGRDSGTTTVAGAPAAQQTLQGRVCGAVSCIEPADPGAPDSRTLVGEPWVIGSPADGVEEVLYAVHTDGVDLTTGDPAMVDVVVAGFRVDGQLYDSLWTLQPGSEGVSPDGDPARFWSGSDGTGFAVIGFVPGATEITWSTPDGVGGAVDGTSQVVIDGYTVFYLTMDQPSGETGSGDEESHGMILIGPGADQPDVTIHSGDGWSCSLSECGSVG